MKYHCNKCKRTLFEDDLASDECRFCGEPYFEGEYKEELIEVLLDIMGVKKNENETFDSSINLKH